MLRRIAEQGRSARHGPARQLGRRGGCPLRPLALRLLGGVRLDERPGRAAGAEGPGRRLASRRACRQRRRSRPCPRGALAARDRGRLPRAPHRAGPGARVDGHPPRRRARHLRRRALADHVDGPGGARGLDADGQAARCARRRGEAGARDPRDRGQGRERRRVHVGRRRLQTGHRDVGRGDGGAAARPASPRRGEPRRAPLAGAGGERPVRAGGGHRGELGADLEHRADPVRLCSDRSLRRGLPQCRRHLAPASVGAAARRGRGGESRGPDRDDVRPEPARPLAHEARGHARRAPRALRAGARPARGRTIARVAGS